MAAAASIKTMKTNRKKIAPEVPFDTKAKKADVTAENSKSVEVEGRTNKCL